MIRKIWDTIVFLFALSALVFPFVRLILSLNGVIIPFDGIMTVLAAPYLILFALAEVPVAVKGLMGRKIQPLNMTYYALAVVMFMFVVPYQQVGTNLTGLNEFVIIRENLVVTNAMTFVMMWVATSFVLCGFGQNGNGDLTWPLGLVVVLFEYVVKIATNLKTEKKTVVIKEAAKPNPRPAAQRPVLHEEPAKTDSTSTLDALRVAQMRAEARKVTENAPKFRSEPTAEQSGKPKHVREEVAVAPERTLSMQVFSASEPKKDEDAKPASDKPRFAADVNKLAEEAKYFVSQLEIRGDAKKNGRSDLNAFLFSGFGYSLLGKELKKPADLLAMDAVEALKLMRKLLDAPEHEENKKRFEELIDARNAVLS